jgi:hypothetical protein
VTDEANVRGDLHENVADVKDTENRRELLALEVEICLEPA